MSGQSIKQVYSAANQVEAMFICGLLEQEGIRARVLGGTLEGVRGGVPMDMGTTSSVWTLTEDYERARTVLLRHQPEPTHCLNCGYNLTGLPDPRCPECGELFARPLPTPSEWQCPGCGERLEGQFSECWNCGRPRPGVSEGEFPSSDSSSRTDD